MSKKEKLQKAKEKEMQKELQEKQFYDFANSRLCDLVKESTPRNKGVFIFTLNIWYARL